MCGLKASLEMFNIADNVAPSSCDMEKYDR